MDRLFFFSSRRRHTSSLRDWSSDVCSSDLYERAVLAYSLTGGTREPIVLDRTLASLTGLRRYKIGRASCRERGAIPGEVGGLENKATLRRHQARKHVLRLDIADSRTSGHAA